FLVFVVVAVLFAVLTFIKKFSFIPVMGVLFCLYLMVEIPPNSWLVFFAWMIVGLMIYFLYGYRKSNLRNRA
ncbi:MAG TPA: amino acid permease C-terminal domain-containing protein, partial [Flavisolibacter sp.]|nr:amino acid permease C-terminal domain-containing protein [Flavisolibacter sp.]